MEPANLDSDEIWIKDDPTQDPSRLRFSPGNLVLYKMENGWVEGEVVKVCQRIEIPPELSGLTIPQPPMPILYIVWPHTEVPEEHYGSHWIHEDTDDCIRPRMQDKTPDPNNFNPVLVPPVDPLHHFYTGITYDPYDKDGTDMLESIRSLGLVDSAARNPDGTINVKVSGTKLTTYTVEIPQEPVFGVAGHAALQVGLSLQQRRPYSNSTTHNDPVETFKASIPMERRFSEMEAASRTSNEKMLQLGDALMSGVHGWPRDVNRACLCYRAAAWGCQEDEEPNRIGIPVGSPEAMVQYASVIFTYIKKDIMGMELWDNVRAQRLIDKALRDERGKSIICQMFFWLVAAGTRGHIAPLTLEVATAVQEMDLACDRRVRDDEDIQEFVQELLRVKEYRELELVFEELQNTGVVPRGDPSGDVIELFGASLNRIFRSIPMSQTEVVHIEYRQVPQVPFPVHVYAINPHRKKFVKVVRLPDYLQVCAYTRESFIYAWQRIAFELHLGDPATQERTRPSTFTILDTNGNQQFAEYLRSEIQDSGTEVRLVSHLEPIRAVKGGRRRRETILGDIVKQLENRLLEIPNYLVNETTSAVNSTAELEGRIHDFADQLATEHENNPEQLQLKAQQFKDQGNQLFASNDFIGGTRCYSISIELLRRLSNPNDEALILLGTCLSNRAQCYLSLEEHRTSVAFQKLLVQNAVRDCTAALKNSWARRVLPNRIADKLKFRKDRASARLDVLESDFQSEIATIIFPPSSRARSTEQQDTLPPDRLEANDGSSFSDTMNQSADAVTRERNDGVRTRVPDTVDDLMLEKGQTIFKNALAKNFNDGCPICLREFGGELSHVFSPVLPCGEHAFCVECICRLKKKADKEMTRVACSLCRFEFDGKVVQDLAYRMIEHDQRLAGVVESFPTEFEEAVEIANRLLWKNDFNVEKVVELIDKILDDRVSGFFFRAPLDLTHEQKERIYQRARLPVNRLEDKRQRLVEEMRTTFETPRLRELDLELRKYDTELAMARLKARDEIYEQFNSVGNMGAQNSQVDDILQVDFHGLHVAEMHSKYTELIEGILPVLKKVRIITGRGLHSEGGSSKLMKALKKKVEKGTNTRWEKIPGNPGAVIVAWVT